MTRREQAIEIAEKAHAEYDILRWRIETEDSDEELPSGGVFGAIADALIAAGAIPGEGMVAIDAQRWERVRKIAGRAKTADRAERVAMLEVDQVRRARLQVESFMRRIEMGESCDDLQPGDLDAIPDAEHAGIP